MAVAYASIATAQSATVAKPSGLLEGELMVGAIAYSDSDANALSAASISGWTQVVTLEAAPGAMTLRLSVLYKYASAADAAASDFTFTTDADADSHCGAIMRFTGAAAAPTGAIDAEATADTTPTFANTTTPTYINNILLFIVASGGDVGSQAVSAYAIATDNPTWTERADFVHNPGPGDGDTSLAIATGPRAAMTATGNADCTLAAAPSASIGAMIAVYPQVDVSVSPAVVSLVGTVQAPSVSGGATVSPAVVTMTATIQAPTVTTPANKWTNPDKNSASWTNPDKTT